MQRWSDALIKTAHENGWDIDDLDQGVLIACFANYWAAIHDPLQTEIEQLKREVKTLNIHLNTARRLAMGHKHKNFEDRCVAIKMMVDWILDKK